MTDAEFRPPGLGVFMARLGEMLAKGLGAVLYVLHHLSGGWLTTADWEWFSRAPRRPPPTDLEKL